MADAPAPTPDNEQQPDTVEQTIAQASPSDAPLLSEPNESPAATDTSVAEPTAETVEAAEAVEATEAAETPEPAAETAAKPIQATETAEPVVLSADTPLSDAALSETPLSGVNEAASVSNTIDSPTVASTLEVPANPMATEAAADQEGGEWELLLAKVRHWISSGQLQEQWQTVRTPLSLLAGLIALLLVLRVYSALLGVLDSIPVLPGLLELAGLIAVAQFSLTRLVRSDDRRDVINGLRQRWQSFRGRS